MSGETSGKASSSLDVDSLLKEHKESIAELIKSLKENSEIESSLKQAKKQNEELQYELSKAREEIGRIKESVRIAESSESPQTNSLKEDLKSAETKKFNLETSLEQSSKAVKSLESSLASKTHNTHDLEKKMVEKLTAAVEGSAKSSATGAGAITPGQQGIEISKVLHEMQDEYLNNLNADALGVACIVAMDRPVSELTAFGRYCMEQDILGRGVSILKDTIDKKFKFKEMKLMQKAGESQAKASSSFVVFDQRQPQDIKRLQNKLNTITNAGIVEDGIYGEKTSVAILRFQVMSGLIVDGQPNQETLKRLGM